MIKLQCYLYLLRHVLPPVMTNVMRAIDYNFYVWCNKRGSRFMYFRLTFEIKNSHTKVYLCILVSH